MNTEMKDPRGTKLRVGQTVIFNQSGKLNVGEIVKFYPKGKGRIDLPPNIHVQVRGEKKKSVVRWPSSVFVIPSSVLEEDEDGYNTKQWVKVDSPPYFEDYEECGYCHRKPFTHHKGYCRQ
jgi:hypothetical protein